MLRSHGLGVRAGFWNAGGGSLSLSVTNSTNPTNQGTPTVELDGYVGGWLYYFSRLDKEWFLEFNLGGLSSVSAASEAADSVSVDVNAIVPILIGIRRYIFSFRFPSRVMPYLNAGIGPYWQSAIEVEDSIDETETVFLESKMDMGGFLGGGTDIALSSWLALNMDVKYHFVDFQSKNVNSGAEINFGLSFRWGKRPQLFRVKDTRMITANIYPAYYQYYNGAPLALVTVENTAGFPIDINIRSRMHPFSHRWKNSGFARLAKNETKDFTVKAVLGNDITNVEAHQPAVLEVQVEGKGGTTLKQEVSLPLTVHSRNAWNGDIDMLSFFLTPDAPDILDFSRELVRENSTLDQPSIGNLTIARVLFEELKQMGLLYQSDPNIPFYKDDRVQFASETLRLGSGDCDDLVVLYASLLQSLGINTSFVRVQDPEKSIAHLYLIFDSGVPIEQAAQISSNEKRYVVRETPADERFAGSEEQAFSTVWIPVETTKIPEGFEASWNAGALQYLQEGVVRNGLLEGWVEVIDVE